MSTLKVNKIRDTAGSADSITLDPNGGAVIAGVTTVTSVKVGAAVTISESGIEASGIGITCANINGTQIGGRRNLIINGAMLVAQRGTSGTATDYQSVDRIQSEHSNADEAPTRAQVDVSSGTSPYTEGFRKAYKMTNGNQTSGAGADDITNIRYKIEAQDIANSGWNYTSSTSFITLQFWIKSSVSQNFNMYLRTRDGSNQTYAFDTGTLSADTWTKIIKTIPGNSSIQIDNDTGEGLQLNFGPFWGTNRTNDNVTNEVWQGFNSASRMKDNTTTWYTTNDATLELTGVQLEVGPQATAFEHRSFGEELSLCQRYYYKHAEGASKDMGVGTYYTANLFAFSIKFPVTMRSAPTLDYVTGTNYYQIFHNNTNDLFDAFAITRNQENCAAFDTSTGTSGVQGSGGILNTADASSYVALNAEL